MQLVEVDVGEKIENFVNKPGIGNVSIDSERFSVNYFVIVDLVPDNHIPDQKAAL